MKRMGFCLMAELIFSYNLVVRNIFYYGRKSLYDAGRVGQAEERPC